MDVGCYSLLLCASQQLHNSTDTQVVLDNVNLASTGRYRCEVSAEAPSFQTVSDHGDMIVVGEFSLPPINHKVKLSGESFRLSS